MFHPKGGILRKALEDYVRQRHIEEGFDFVATPHISKDGLFHTSGHLPYYADTMFPPMHLEESEYRLKAMNCPMHNLIFRSRGRSYRELPLRLFELGAVYRYEKSGVVHGLTRVRGLTMDDSHSYCTAEQAPAEITHLLNFCLGLFRDFGLDDFYLELSTRDDSKPDKFIGSDEEWETATKVLEDTALASGLDLVPDPGGAAYYGPEDLGAGARRDRPHLADVDDPVRLQPARPLRARVSGRRRRATPAGDDPLGEVRFGRAVHRRADRALRRRVPGLALAGAGDRDPGQRRAGRCTSTTSPRGCARPACASRSIPSDDRMQKKIRAAQKQKVPFMLIAGATDVEAGAVSFRYRDGSQRNGIPVEQAHQPRSKEFVDRRVNTSPTAELYG